MTPAARVPLRFTRLLPVALGAALAFGCSELAPPAVQSADTQTTQRPTILDSTQRLIDLTHALSPDGLYWPTGEPFVLERLAWGNNDAGDWYAAAAFSSPEHLGTHLDAPIHFSESGWTSADIPVDNLVGPGVLIDISSRANTDPDATLHPDDIAAWESAHGRLPNAAIVLVRTGWSERWPDWNTYYGSETPMDVATLHFPGVSPEAAKLLAERSVAGVGIDTASIDPGSGTGFATHRVLGAANIFNLENLTNLTDLPPVDFLVLAMPMKIEGGTGGPARVVAAIPSTTN